MKKRFLITFILLSLNHIMANVNSNNMPTPGPVAHYQAKFHELSGQASSKLNFWDDSTNQTYGPELVTNGDFSNGSTDWIFAGGSSITSNQANILSVTGEYSVIRQNDVYEIGKTYKITYDVIATDGQNLRNNSNLIIFPTSTLGAKSVIAVADEVHFFMKRPSAGVPCNVIVDNISVKEVLTGANDLTQSTSGNQPTLVEQNVMTQFTSSRQPTFVEGFSGTGDELVTNGDFSAGDTGWEVEAIWNITGGEASSDGSSSTQGDRDLVQRNVLEVGKDYFIEFDVTSYTSGNLRVWAGGPSNDIKISAGIGRKSITLRSVQVNGLFFNGGTNAFVGSIDNILVKEAVKDTTKDKVSFDTNDFMEGLPPQNEPASFGSELITNGDFSDGSTNWGLTGGTSIISNQANILSVTGEYSAVTQSNRFEIGKTYKITYDVISTDGQNLRSNSGQVIFPTSTTGSKSHIFTADETTFVMKRPTPGTPANVTVDNISVKEITGYQDFTYVFKGLDIPDNNTPRYLLTGSGTEADLRIRSDNKLALEFKDVSNVVLHTITDFSFSELALVKESNTFKVYINGVFKGQSLQADKIFDASRLGDGANSLNGSLQSLEVYDVAVSDVNNITEVPVYTLKSDLVDIPSGYGPMYKWYAKEHNPNDNKIKLDSNDFMKGLPPQSGDFTYVFKGLTIADNLEQRLLSDGVSSNFRLNTSSNLIQTSLGGAQSTLGTFTGTSFNSVTFKREGTTISAYIDGVLAGTPVTNSGNFVGSRLMHDVLGLNGSLQELCVYDRALTEEEIEIVSDPNYEFNSDSTSNESDNYPWQDDSNNIFIGYQAGQNETDSNKLYIENSDSSSPLIYGEFDKDLVRINGQFNVSDNAQIDGQLIVSSKAQIDGELRVAGGIRTNEVNVQLQSAWPDYVFADDYQLPTIMEMSKHIKKHKHLPGVPSAADIAKDGLDMAKIMTAQMEKIEELSLYIIELKKENQILKQNQLDIYKVLQELRGNE